MHDVAKKLDYDQFKDRSPTGALDIAQYIFGLAVATGEKSVFVHFDETTHLLLFERQVCPADCIGWN